MTSPAGPRLITAEEFLHLSFDGTLQELVEGTVVNVGASSGAASVLGLRIGAEMWLFVREHKLGTVCGEACGFRLFTDPDTVRAPDVAFVRADRLDNGRAPRGFFNGGPDLGVEVVSPTNRWSELWRKAEEYRRSGSRLIWIVDLDRRATTVCLPDGSTQTVSFDEPLDGRDVLPGFSLRLASLGF